MYKPDDFNLTNAPKEMVQYIIDSTPNFHSRYQLAFNKGYVARKPIRMVDNSLFIELENHAYDWCCSHNFNFYDVAGIEEIFG